MEYERIREEAILTPKEIRTANIRVLKRHRITLPQTLEDYLELDETERLTIIEEQHKEQLEAQLDKVLKHKDVLLRAENQDPPECKHLAKETFYLNRVCPMLTPKDGYVWVKCLERKVKEEQHGL